MIVCTIYSFEVRIEAMILQEEFHPSCVLMNREITIVRQATEGKNKNSNFAGLSLRFIYLRNRSCM